MTDRNTYIKTAQSIRAGDIVLWHGVRMEVTYSRKSRQYSGYQAVQMRPANEPDARIISHNIHVGNEIACENSKAP